jgi:hypothetical protein
VLATLAIIVWHFYHVISTPDIYPVSWTWCDGKISKHQQEEEHGLRNFRLSGILRLWAREVLRLLPQMKKDGRPAVLSS